jgi:hypothetical protein
MARRCATPCLKRSPTAIIVDPPALEQQPAEDQHSENKTVAVSQKSDLSSAPLAVTNLTTSKVNTVGASPPDLALETAVAPTKKYKFTAPKRSKAAPTPSISSLVQATACPKKPSAALRGKIGDWKVVAGIDVETHGWVDVESVGGVGQYGFYCVCPPAKLLARIVTLGWVVGEVFGEPVRKERMVKPVGFRVEEKATRFHGITHDRAESEGLPLAEVLAEFLDDMLAARQAGGRVVAHHLEFDAGIISKEIDNAGMGARKQEWDTFVRTGFCTMDPALSIWLRECAGTAVSPDANKNIMKLPAVVAALRPYRSWPQWVQHVAGDDAHIHFAIYGALVELMHRADAE